VWGHDAVLESVAAGDGLAFCGPGTAVSTAHGYAPSAPSPSGPGRMAPSARLRAGMRPYNAGMCPYTRGRRGKFVWQKRVVSVYAHVQLARMDDLLCQAQ
jgi:hypothetical protein